MIYFVTRQQSLFNSELYKVITPEESLAMMAPWGVVQYDSETTGVNCHIATLLTMQFGNEKADAQIVVDCTTVDPLLYKEILENKRLIGFNLKFDLEFLYNYGIVPRKIYDAMIVEQLLFLGYPHEVKKYSLKAVAYEYLGIDIDKSIRGEIIWKGLSDDVINYAAGDVKYLEAIMRKQLEECRKKGCLKGAEVECDAVPAMAYLEWCGIKLDEEKWKAKMEYDRQALKESEKKLSEYAVNHPKLQKWVEVDRQGDLWNGFDLTPRWKVDWQKKQVNDVVKALGFNVVVQDKKTGADKESIMEKNLKIQKGIDDEFLKLYFDYQEHYKVCTSFGQGHLNAVNPKTGRIHTTYRQLGAASGRMSCGSTQPDTELAKLKGLRPSECTFPNVQQLPHDEMTRSSFVAEEGNVYCASDFGSEEARLAGDIYQDEAILDMFRRGLDSHSVYAKAFFKEQLADVPVEEIKAKYPNLRQLAKGPEFALNFGGGAKAIMQAIGCSQEEADTIIKNYEEGFKGTAEFAKRGEKFVKQHGYVLICPITGHKMYWWDWKQWKERQNSFTPAFWEEYNAYHKNTGDNIAMMVKQHFKAASKWARMARNAPCQGTAAVILKTVIARLFNRIVDDGLFNKVKLCALVHDEVCIEYPKELDYAPILVDIMESSAAMYCKSLPIPANAEVSTHWVH